MIEGRKVLAVIPARGGSKGVPRKNIRELAGKPLIAWTIDCAARTQFIDRCVISTDDEEIAAVSRSWGGDVPFIRPEELARDDTAGIDVVLHAVELFSGYDIVVLLQPTSPLRTPEDVDGCIKRLVQSGAPSCVTVSESAKSPLWMYHVDESGAMRPLMETSDRTLPRQKIPPVYVLNGAVYAADTEWLERSKSYLTERTVSYIMQPERSIDIDNEDDLWLAERRITV